jgi:hypothetical protein
VDQGPLEKGLTRMARLEAAAEVSLKFAHPFARPSAGQGRHRGRTAPNPSRIQSHVDTSIAHKPSQCNDGHKGSMRVANRPPPKDPSATLSLKRGRREEEGGTDGAMLEKG